MADIPANHHNPPPGVEYTPTTTDGETVTPPAPAAPPAPKPSAGKKPAAEKEAS